MTAYVVSDPVVDLSLALREIPYEFRFARCNGNEGGYQVELYSGNVAGSGISQKSFAAAYTAAKLELELQLAKENNEQ